MAVNLDHLRYFVCLAQVQHYTRAAQQLCISQPSLSHAIHQLEAELGVPLFEKTGRNTTLTCFGEEFLRSTRQSLAALDEGVEALRRSARGEGLIRLGFLRVLGCDYIPRLAAEFLAAHPGENIRFTFHSDRTQPLLDCLTEQRCDLIFCSKPAPELPFTAVPVFQQELVLIVPQNHPLAERSEVDLTEILPYPMVYFSRDSGLRRVVDGLFAAIGAAPHIACETEEDQVVAGLVAHGFGAAVLPDMDLLEKLDVVKLRLHSPDHRRDVFLVTDRGRFLSPAADRFRRFVLERSKIGETP